MRASHVTLDLAAHDEPLSEARVMRYDSGRPWYATVCYLGGSVSSGSPAALRRLAWELLTAAKLLERAIAESELRDG